MSDEITPKRRRLSGLHLHLLAGAAVGGLAVLAALVQNAGDVRTWLVPVIIGLAVVVGRAFALAGWRRLDEAAKEAHKWAWYWGASVGMVGALLLIITEGGPAALARLGVRDTFEDGVVTVLTLELLGYIVAWAYWWLKRR